MKLWHQSGGWWSGLALSAALALPGVPMGAAQHPPKNTPPRSAPGPKAEPRGGREADNRRNDRPPNTSRRESAPHSAVNENRPPVVPRENPQERLRNMTPLAKQRLAQNEDRLRHLPPSQQQELKESAKVWQKMTPAQRDHVKTDVLPRWKQMPPDHKQAVQQRLRRLQNMPESARDQRLNDPEFTRGMNEEDKATLRDLSHLHVGGAPEPPNE